MKILRVVDDVALHVVEISADIRYLGIFPLEIGDEHADRVGGDLAIERLDPFAMFFPQLRHIFYVCLQLVAELADGLLNLAALFLRQLAEFFFVDNLAVTDRREHVPGRRLQHADAFLLRPLLEIAPLFLEFLLRRCLDGLELGPVVLAFEGRRDREPQFLDQFAHVVAELPAGPRGEAQCSRSFRIGEVIDVAPVSRRRFACRLRFGELLCKPVPPGTVASQDEDVMAVACDLDAKLDGVDCALMTERSGPCLELVRALEVDAERIAGAAQAVERYLESVSGVVCHACCAGIPGS